MTMIKGEGNLTIKYGAAFVVEHKDIKYDGIYNYDVRRSIFWGKTKYELDCDEDVICSGIDNPEIANLFCKAYNETKPVQWMPDKMFKNKMVKNQYFQQ